MNEAAGGEGQFLRILVVVAPVGVALITFLNSVQGKGWQVVVSLLLCVAGLVTFAFAWRHQSRAHARWMLGGIGTAMLLSGVIVASVSRPASGEADEPSPTTVISSSSTEMPTSSPATISTMTASTEPSPDAPNDEAESTRPGAVTTDASSTTTTTTTTTITTTTTPTTLPPTIASNTASTIDGTTIAAVALVPGTEVGSIVGSDTRPSEVYVIQLIRGQTLQVEVEAPSGLGSIRLLGPDSVDLGGNYELLDTWRMATDTETFSFRASRDGPHYLWVIADQVAQRYSLMVLVTVDGDPVDGDVVSDIPGATLDDGVRRTFVVDVDDAADAVFAAELCAGETLSVEISAPYGLGRVQLLAPQSTSVAGGFRRLETWTLDDTVLKESYTAAASGTYYLWVRAAGRAQVFTIVINKDAVCLGS